MHFIFVTSEIFVFVGSGFCVSSPSILDPIRNHAFLSRIGGVLSEPKVGMYVVIAVIAVRSGFENDRRIQQIGGVMLRPGAKQKRALNMQPSSCFGFSG